MNDTFQNFHFEFQPMLDRLTIPGSLLNLLGVKSMLNERFLIGGSGTLSLVSSELSLSSESGAVGGLLPPARKWEKRKTFSIWDGGVATMVSGVEGGVDSGVIAPESTRTADSPEDSYRVKPEPSMNELSRWRSRIAAAGIGGVTLTDLIDPGLLAGMKVISFALAIQARGGDLSTSTELVERSNAPLSNKSAIVHSGVMFSEEAVGGIKDGAVWRTALRSVYGCIRNGAARSMPAESGWPTSTELGYAKEQRKPSMLCMSLLREAEGDVGGTR